MDAPPKCAWLWTVDCNSQIVLSGIRCPYRLKEFVVNWFEREGFGFHAGECLAFGLTILLSFPLCIALLRLVFGLFKRKGETDKSERDYWRIHGG